MSIENMKRISEAEDEAVSIRRQAQADVRKIAEQSKRDVAALLEKSRGDANAGYREKIQQAEAEAQDAYDKRLGEVASECEAMKTMARRHLPEAVSLITGKVVSTSGIG